MNARDELRGTLSNTVCNASFYPTRAQPYLLGGDMSKVLDKTADAILAAGYTKPRTITTAEELDALGHGSVIRSEHRHYWVAHKEDGMGTDQGWATAGGGAITSRQLTSWLPASVLYEPRQS